MCRRIGMGRVGILLLMKAKPGKEEDLERFLQGTWMQAEAELRTQPYFVFRKDRSHFGIFLTAKDEASRAELRRTHIAGTLYSVAKEFCDPIPVGENVDILVEKMPVLLEREQPEDRAVSELEH
jgi:hypothetical protein